MSKKKKQIPLPQLAPGIKAVDTHCHLDMSAYREDLDEVIGLAEKAGVSIIITVGIDLESSEKAVEIARKYDSVYATVGIHPHNVNDIDESHFSRLKKLAGEPKVVAYGEIGMDFVKKYCPVEQQRMFFKRQVELAKEVNLPLIVHDREAHEEIMEILEQAAPFPAGGVMHCFSGDAALAKRVCTLGFYISIPGVLTYNKTEMLQEAVKQTPLSSMLLETDGPFLAPVPRRGKRNEPSCVLYTAQKVAEIKGTTVDEVARTTTENVKRLFKIDC